MKLSPRALSPLAALVALLIPQAQASAAPAKVAAKAAAPAKPAIIPLPLNPVVPADQRVCTAKAASGLGSTMLRPATGAQPAEADYVLVNYIGYLAATGAVFDQGMQASFPVNGVIPGFSQGLQMLAKGGIVRLCIPAALGYGAQESGPIPANSDLVFQVELLDFRTVAELEAMRKARDAQTPPATAPAGAAPQ